MKSDDFRLESLEVGGAPVVQRFVEHLDLPRLFQQYVPPRQGGRPAKLSCARALTTMVSNVLLSRLPLYAIPQWAGRFLPEHLGLRHEEISLLNDDRIGRALDELYAADPASLMTAIVTRAVRVFDLDLDQIHNDTTTVQFAGAYRGQKSKEDPNRPPLITFGHAKKGDRPDFKQLIYALTITADGAVPVHFKTHDGNTTDDKIHKEVWSTVRKLVGTSDFLYVADSKLCTRENMEWIDSQAGRFITVMPETRGESKTFKQSIRNGATAPWAEVRRDENPRYEDGPDLVYDAYEPKETSSEGFRIIWYRSSQKVELDAQRRTDQISKARDRISRLEMRRGRYALRSEATARDAARQVVKEEGVERWLTVDITAGHVKDYRQIGPGRPGKDTKFEQIRLPIFLFTAEEKTEAVRADARCDGIFPLITNAKAEVMTPRQVLDKYKYQPFLEKRNEQLKSVLKVAPVLLKKPERVAALLFVYFVATLLMALIERELRRKMADAKIESLPLYPEQRLCKAPTWEVMLENLQGFRRHRLLNADGTIANTFHDRLSAAARDVLRLLNVSSADFGT